MDETDDSNFDLIQKLMYNILRLFKPNAVKTTIVGFGKRPRIIVKGKSFPNSKDIQNTVVKFRPAANKKTYVGRALRYVRSKVVKKMPKNVPRVVITILSGGSDDNFKAPFDRLNGDGVRMLSIGMFIFLLVIFLAQGTAVYSLYGKILNFKTLLLEFKLWDIMIMIMI